MGPQSGPPVAGEPLSVSPTRDAANDYRRLLATLAARARRLGSRDPEGAAQEALKRSLENLSAQPAVEYYFSLDPPAALQPPAWPLDQLFAWLHGVLHNVVREEYSKAGSRREISIDGLVSGRADENNSHDPADPAPGQLDALLRKELRGIVANCFPALAQEYRTVLKMRAQGLKYGDIAIRLGISENTVATWVSRGIRELAQCVRRRTRGISHE